MNSQFAFFREKYNLCGWVYQTMDGLYHYFIMKDKRYALHKKNSYETYDKAQLECLNQLKQITT